jgi:hypothetical protein
MSESTYVCGRCHAVCTSEDAVYDAIVPAGIPSLPSQAISFCCPACWEELGFVDPEEGD